MAKLRRVGGGNLREIYTFFEIEALKYAFSEQMHVGQTFERGGTREKFEVIATPPGTFGVLRCNGNKEIMAAVVDNETAAAPAATKAAAQAAPAVASPAGPVKSGGNGNGNTNAVAQKIAEALSGLVMDATGAPVVDKSEMQEMITAAVRKEIASYTPRVEVRVNDAAPVQVDGLTHEKFAETLFWAAQRVPVYLYGPAGTGKNVLCEQVAKSLGLPFYYASSLQFKTDLEGFVNAAGEFVETDFYKAMKDGGVFMLDEIDATAAEVLVAFGGVLSARYYNFPKVGMVRAHKDFVIIAAGNTAGRGANAAYNGRFQLDASTTDKFAFLQMGYDKRIELAAAGGNAGLVDFAHELRAVIEKCGLSYTVSCRALKRITLGLQCGNIDKKTLFASALCAGWAKNDMQIMSRNLNGNNEFVEMFKQLAYEE